MTEITHVESKIDKQGSHRHRCTNPANQTFDIGCFAEAPGCVPAGAATGDYSWFTGYRWRVALCRRCTMHLGWVFTGAADRFHGLILNQLIDTQ